MSTAESFPAALGRLPPLARANLAALGGFVVLLCWLFLPQWRHNPDLAHGLLMPVVFLVLLRESRVAGPRRYLPAGAGATAAVVALGLAALAVLSMAGLYAAAVDWSNALVDFLLATALSLLLGSALVSLAEERVRLLPCNWTALVAVGLWPL